MLRVAPRLFVRLFAATDAELGRVGEALAAAYLRRLGWKLIARRLKTGRGELDLVFLDGRALVGVEVKSARRWGRYRPGHRVDGERLARLRRATLALARRAGIRHARVDLVEVVLAGRRIVHHRDLRQPLG